MGLEDGRQAALELSENANLSVYHGTGKKTPGGAGTYTGHTGHADAPYPVGPSGPHEHTCKSSARRVRPVK